MAASKQFYAISLPDSTLSNDENSNRDNGNKNDDSSLVNLSPQDMVFTDKAVALKELKKHKGARFKAFDTRLEALEYSRQRVAKMNDIVTFTPEPPSPFREPKPPELAKLRRNIESDHYDLVKETIWSNPRYLISSGETPQILMAGPRYNAAIVAAKAGRTKILKLILDTVTNPEFIETMYPDCDDFMLQKRIDRLLDLYLNTPDHSGCDTPLHYACKFGHADVVSLLLSYAVCDSKKLNSFNEAPIDVICTRRFDEDAKNRINAAFETVLYISVERDADYFPKVRRPSYQPFVANEVHGLAGPMSPEQAQELYKSLKSPTKAKYDDNTAIRLSDPQKGIERVARKKCREMGIKWVEYWPFLNSKIDLASIEGLSRLETHFKKVYEDLKNSRLPSSESAQNSIFLSDSPGTISKLCIDFGNLGLNSMSNEESNLESSFISTNDDEDDPESYFTAPSSPTFSWEFYINGSEKSTWDINAAIAINGEHIDPVSYPFVYDWFSRINLQGNNYIASPNVSASSPTSNMSSPRFSSTPQRPDILNFDEC